MLYVFNLLNDLDQNIYKDKEFENQEILKYVDTVKKIMHLYISWLKTDAAHIFCLFKPTSNTVMWYCINIVNIL